MAFVFLGSFCGILIGKAIGSDAQCYIFAATVAWSIYTTTKKAITTCKEESERDAKKKGVTTPLMEGQNNNSETVEAPANTVNEGGEKKREAPTEADRKAFEDIKNQDLNHFTCDRIILILLNFGILFGTQVVFKSKAKWSTMQIKIGVVVAFALVCIGITAWQTNRINKQYLIREKFDANDPRGFNFKSKFDVAKIAVICAVAAMLCGMTGIAGGMVLGPLFLSYNMVGVVMQSTNQYITLVASLSVCIQFIMLNELNWLFCALFGVATVISAFIGIKGV